jgi:hypothetical protein
MAKVTNMEVPTDEWEIKGGVTIQDIRSNFGAAGEGQKSGRAPQAGFL